MLSLSSRDEGRKGLGLGFRSREGAMEENELEEGEAFSGQEDDSCIDPDIALSYIDAKLQDVLGHFQKDFEGGVSAENLGAKFGGYGSFLPTYQRSPSALSTPKSPPRPQNNGVLKSPYKSSVENSLAPRIAPVSKNNTTSAAHPGNSGIKENSINIVNAVVSAPHHDYQNKTVNGSDRKSLKVRIKVGPDNPLARSKAAIYSGLGLDTSPSSSPEDSPDASPGFNPGFRVAPGESPLTILEVMTSFSVPGGYLLSPLNEILAHLADNKCSFSRYNGKPSKGVPEMRAVHSTAVPVGDTKGYSEKKSKSDEKNGRPKEEEISNCKVDTMKMLKKEVDVDIDTPPNKRPAFNVLNITLQSCSRSADPKAEQHVISDSIKGCNRATGISKELNNKPSGKDQLPDSFKDDQYLSIGSSKSGGMTNIGNGTTQSKSLNSKTSLLEKELEEKNTGAQRDISSDTRKEEKSKVQKNHDTARLNLDKPNGQYDHVNSHVEPTKQMHAQKINSHENPLEKMLQGNGSAYQSKKRQKGSRNDCEPITESTQEILRASSVVTKEKKKSSHVRGGHSESKSKLLKSRKETNRFLSRDSHRDALGNINAVRVENRTDLPESFRYAEKPVERAGVKKDFNLYSELTANPPTVTSTFAEAAAPTLGATTALGPPPPVVIEDNWVCCDKCQKWRLLPYGTDPDHLPKKWKCSLQVWLPPGLNSCLISEDETNKAFNALYLVPAPETGANLNGLHDVAASSINQQYFDGMPDHSTQSGQSTGKKKFGLFDASNIPKNHASKKNLQASVKRTSSNDVNEDPLETNSSAKGYHGLSNKSVDLTAEKHNRRQKQKYKIPGHHSHGGDFVGKSGNHSNSKGKREANQDERVSKKIKKGASEYLVQDRLSDLDMDEKAARNMNNNSLPSKVNVKILQNYSDQSSSRDSRSELRGNLSASTKKLKYPMDSNEELKEHFRTSDVDKSVPHDVAAKKRKVKEWQESMDHKENAVSAHHALDDRLIVKEAFSESELKKQKKAKVSKSEGKESGTSNVDGKMDKKDRANRNLLSGNGQQCFDGMRENGGVVARKEQMRHKETVASRQALDVDPLKREIAHPQLPTAATSSSSKVSGSRKSKGNFQEARGSPVESVSSSPLRISAAEKLSTKRNSTATDDVMVNTGPSFKGSPKRCFDGELVRDQSGSRRKETGPTQPKSSDARDADFGVLDSVGVARRYTEKGESLLSAGYNKDEACLRSGQVDLSSAEFVETNAVGDIENMFDHDNKYIFERPEKDNIDNDRDNLSNHHRLNGISERKSGKSSSKDRNRMSNFDVDRGKLKVSDPLVEKNELYLTKNASNCQPEPDFNGNKDSTCREDTRGENCSLREKDGDYKGKKGKKTSSGKWSRFDITSNHSNNGFEENFDAQHRDLSSRVLFAGASSRSNLQEDLPLPPSFPSENLPSHAGLNRIDRSETASSRGISQSFQVVQGKTEAQVVGSQTIHTPIRGSRSQQYPIDELNGDAPRAVKQSRKPDSQNGLNHSSLRLPHTGGHDSSPMRKDAHAVASVVLKEARDLKHTSNRLKIDGLEHESIGLCFQAALKYLHGAFLLEPSCAESAKPGEINSSMQVYSDTARLCKFCAHEYERFKEMAAAALAYKCVEVAYMKVAYYKHTDASKDRHELLTSLQTALPGESPSSSASDVDNLNNQGGLDKAVALKAVGSPQIAGNHVIAARNRPSFMRMLSYTNDLNCVFDATKRYQNAIAVASLRPEKDGADGLCSVRKVLDFNFQNVEELIRLVRMSMESISL